MRDMHQRLVRRADKRLARNRICAPRILLWCRAKLANHDLRTVRKARHGNDLLNGTCQGLGRLLELSRIDRAGVNHEYATHAQEGQTELNRNRGRRQGACNRNAKGLAPRTMGIFFDPKIDDLNAIAQLAAIDNLLQVFAAAGAAIEQHAAQLRAVDQQRYAWKTSAGANINQRSRLAHQERQAIAGVGDMLGKRFRALVRHQPLSRIGNHIEKLLERVAFHVKRRGGVENCFT